MSEELLLTQCSPTLAGIKTGSLFSCPVKDKKVFLKGVRRYNSRLVPKGARMIPVRFTETRALVYLYRPSRLAADLGNGEAKAILSEKGYPVGDCDRCVYELSKRLSAGGEFPHEIGLFLGYPPGDVRGFLSAKKAVYSGLWKVYGDLESAVQKFAMYKKCTAVYREAFKRHNSFEKLIVSSI